MPAPKAKSKTATQKLNDLEDKVLEQDVEINELKVKLQELANHLSYDLNME